MLLQNDSVRSTAAKCGSYYALGIVIILIIVMYKSTAGLCVCAVEAGIVI